MTKCKVFYGYEDQEFKESENHDDLEIFPCVGEFIAIAPIEHNGMICDIVEVVSVIHVFEENTIVIKTLFRFRPIGTNKDFRQDASYLAPNV